MTLPKDYLDYPMRRRGNDHDRYAMEYVGARAKRTLAGGAALGLAVIVPLEFFMLNPSGAPFKHPGAMQTPYPDLRHFTTRDYGNRVGAFRLLDAFAQTQTKATFAINAALLSRIRPLIDAIGESGHEIAAHGLDTDSIHWSGVDLDTEKRYVDETRAAFKNAGLAPRVWMSPARHQSAHTPDLIAQAGFDICLDWESDTTPVAMKTRAGPLNAFPVLNELDDRTILVAKGHDEAAWRDQLLEAAAMTASESARYGAQCFGFTMTPYIAGQPFRMWAVRDILDGLAGRDDIRVDSVSAIVDALT